MIDNNYSIDTTFAQAPTYETYEDNKSNINPETVVFVEESGMEKLITQEKEYDFVPSGGSNGQVLMKTENGLGWGTVQAGNDSTCDCEPIEAIPIEDIKAMLGIQ